MAANIQIGGIQIASATNNTGIFSGQNAQSNWDSHSPIVTARGGIFGNHSLGLTGVAVVHTHNLFGQPILDQDVKLNGSPMYIGP